MRRNVLHGYIKAAHPNTVVCQVWCSSVNESSATTIHGYHVTSLCLSAAIFVSNTDTVVYLCVGHNPQKVQMPGMFYCWMRQLSPKKPRYTISLYSKRFREYNEIVNNCGVLELNSPEQAIVLI